MTSIGQYSRKNPTIKRILKEAAELNASPSPDYHAEPLEDNLFEWHFTLRGPPAPSPYAGGMYHGRISLPASYPLKPPNFRFTTPTGRFETNREICLSISGHHEEMWQPAWGVRTALVAIRSFMDSEAKGQLGGLETTREAREKMAIESAAVMCATCGKRNSEILKEQELRVVEAGEEERKEEVPEELRLAYKEELAEKNEEKGLEKDARLEQTTAVEDVKQSSSDERITVPVASSVTDPAIAVPVRTSPPRAGPQGQQQNVSAAGHAQNDWLDKVIWAVVIALAIMIAKKVAQ